MAELVPHPFGRLLRRMFTELERDHSIFDLPAKKFVTGLPGKEIGVEFQDKPAGNPFGPAAGPQSQLAQNLVLSFLCGGRIFELKTVQINDELTIPRPCIDMQTAGYNVEWSQELKLEQSLEEYVKGSMLIEILIASGKLNLAPGWEHFLFDMSVGYDLAGVQSERVCAFLDGMKDCSLLVEKFRAEIPEEFKQFRELEFRTRLSETLTLSTFHGCPPDEIEKILEYLIKEHGLNVIVKLNPTLLGKSEARRIFGEVLGYTDEIPDEAFEKDTRWEEAVAFCQRLGDLAPRWGCRFGAKFTNTLIVKNARSFFPASEKVMYLSGLPLHVLAMNLVARFRETFADAYPITFSAGIDRANFPDAAALGLAPITVCSDLLRPGGYGRAQFYFRDLAKRMDEVGATTLGDFVILAHGHGEEALRRAMKIIDGVDTINGGVKRGVLSLGKISGLLGKPYDSEVYRFAKANPPPECCDEHQISTNLRDIGSRALHDEWVRQAKLMNTGTYLDKLMVDPRYTRAANLKLPPKVGSKLSLFDCISCDKCVPVCPNDANFTWTTPAKEIPVLKFTRADSAWTAVRSAPIALAQKHQIANFADFCNECGNCDVFCPEDGGPYRMKPRFFGSAEQWKKWREHDGFFVAENEVLGRFSGREFRMQSVNGRGRYSGDGFEVTFDEQDIERTIDGTAKAGAAVDLTYFQIMKIVRDSVPEWVRSR